MSTVGNGATGAPGSGPATGPLLTMSCQKLSRKCLHLVSNVGRGLYSLSRLNVLGLFYPSTAEAEAAEGKDKDQNNGINKLGVVGSIEHFPRQSVYWELSPSDVSNHFGWSNVIALFGESKNKILCSDVVGNTCIYNTEFHSLIGMPELNSPKGSKCVAVSIPRSVAHARSDFENRPELDPFTFTSNTGGDHTDSLFILDMKPDRPCCFEMLAYYPVGNWCSRPLPLPPFFDDPQYDGSVEAPFTLVDGTKICVSTTTTTYSFDTVEGEWSKVGDWVLPFSAEYVPELGLWLGLSDRSPYYLCALSNLSTAMGSSPPTLLQISREFEPPKSWSLLKHTLVNLGSRRFCIVNVFDVPNDQEEDDSVPVTVFTGVEVLPSELGPRIVRHKSKCFIASIWSVL